MSSSDAFHWRAFNLLLRLLGFGATFCGAVVFVTVGLGLPAIGEGGPVRNAAGLLAGGLVALLGLGFLLLKPFRPDLGDQGPPLSPFRSVRGRRTWWTGDPREPGRE